MTHFPYLDKLIQVMKDVYEGGEDEALVPKAVRDTSLVQAAIFSSKPHPINSIPKKKKDVK